MGASFLARLYSLTHIAKFLESAQRAVLFSANKQNEDGSWFYGEAETQKWIDNFHTGYNLLALKKFSEFTKFSDFNENILKGFKFYKEHFFSHDGGVAKYYHNKTYPIDIHAIAQSFITLVEFKEIDHDNMALAKRIFSWSVHQMQSKRGYFF